MGSSFEYAASIAGIILINVALSGDNAVVIALAAHRLPGPQRRRAVFWGGGLAIAMQAAFTLVVARLLAVPGLRLIGGLMLLGIAGKLMQEEAGAGADEGAEGGGPGARASIVRIALANLAMSFDNVVAVASVCRSDPIRMGLGLAVSGAILFACSAAIVELMARFKGVVLAGAGVLAIAASGMIWHDLAAAWRRSAMATWDLGLGASAGLEARGLFTALVVLACLGLPRWWPAARSRLGDPARAPGGWAAWPFGRAGLRAAEPSAD